MKSIQILVARIFLLILALLSLSLHSYADELYIQEFLACNENDAVLIVESIYNQQPEPTIDEYLVEKKLSQKNFERIIKSIECTLSNSKNIKINIYSAPVVAGFYDESQNRLMTVLYDNKMIFRKLLISDVNGLILRSLKINDSDIEICQFKQPYLPGSEVSSEEKLKNLICENKINNYKDLKEVDSYVEQYEVMFADNEQFCQLFFNQDSISIPSNVFNGPELLYDYYNPRYNLHSVDINGNGKIDQLIEVWRSNRLSDFYIIQKPLDKNEMQNIFRSMKEIRDFFKTSRVKEINIGERFFSERRYEAQYELFNSEYGGYILSKSITGYNGPKPTMYLLHKIDKKNQLKKICEFKLNYVRALN